MKLVDLYENVSAGSALKAFNSELGGLSQLFKKQISDLTRCLKSPGAETMQPCGITNYNWASTRYLGTNRRESGMQGLARVLSKTMSVRPVRAGFEKLYSSPTTSLNSFGREQAGSKIDGHGALVGSVMSAVVNDILPYIHNERTVPKEDVEMFIRLSKQCDNDYLLVIRMVAQLKAAMKQSTEPDIQPKQVNNTKQAIGQQNAAANDLVNQLLADIKDPALRNTIRQQVAKSDNKLSTLTTLMKHAGL